VEFSRQSLESGQSDLLQRLTSEARRLSQQQAYLGKLADYRRLEIELDRALGTAARP
jgi:hypothetical protein